MVESNITGGSNVYCCHGDPLSDQLFVNELTNYRKLKSVHNMIINRQTFVCLSKIQKAIVGMEMRCAYLKQRPDPCWGYIKGKGITGRCIEGRCPRIMKCNPTYTAEQAALWAMSDETKQLYGNPDNQKKYYLVDLVSDLEKQKYLSDSSSGIPKYKAIENKSIEPRLPKKLMRQKVIIGFEETYFGDADNQLSPIWGYVDDIEDDGPIVTSKYGSKKEYVHKKATKQNKERLTKTDEQFGDKEKGRISVEKNESPFNVKSSEMPTIQEMRDRIKESKLLTEITVEWLYDISRGQTVSIVLANEAEMAYVSSMFSKAGIVHDLNGKAGQGKVLLWNAELPKDLSQENVVLSENFINELKNPQSNKDVYSAILESMRIDEIRVTGREFVEFTTGDDNRWGCKNLYGMTHLALRMSDLELDQKLTGTHEISLIKDGENYLVTDAEDDEIYGNTNVSFWEVLKSLKRLGEITDFPTLITDITLNDCVNGLQLQGIGHMRFDEY